MSLIKVKNFDNLGRDIMNRLKLREQQSDKLRNACKEINTLKAELREIKNLLKKVIEK
jgi:hypothetical protein